MTPFPDLERALIDILSPIASAYTFTASDLQEHLPAIRVRRIGGSDDRITDTGRVDVDVYAATRAAAHALAEQVRQLLLAGPHVLPGGVIDRVVTEAAPHAVTHPDPATRQVTATYRATARRPVRTPTAAPLA
ncbi:tail completion protein gp17 [Actinomadura litoris]|uniref:tail completion protein gp17 n=1 Tax=Actinomadura litoris TaxID=2678616 RepID=UPI001FA789F0|nr:hypothetical protein [Actinomadura litoris]